MSDLVNDLLPPNGTSFFKCEDIEICKKELTDGRELLWWISVYKYCVGAVPTDPEFAKKGGHVLVLVVHNGVLFNSTNNWTNQIFRVDLQGESARQIRLYPDSDSAVPYVDNGLKYDISFEMSLPLFRNRGHESFVFRAKYKETLFRKKSSQDALDNVDGRGNRFVISKKSDVHINRLPIRALSVIKCYDPSKPLKITFGQDVYKDTHEVDTFRTTVEIELF